MGVPFGLLTKPEGNAIILPSSERRRLHTAMNNKKLIGVGLLSVLGLIGVVLLVYAAVVNCPAAGCSGTTVIPNGNDTVNGSTPRRYDLRRQC
jgi:hypothetical protein